MTELQIKRTKKLNAEIDRMKNIVKSYDRKAKSFSDRLAKQDKIIFDLRSAIENVLGLMRGSVYAIKKYSGYNPIALEEKIKELEKLI